MNKQYGKTKASVMRLWLAFTGCLLMGVAANAKPVRLDVELGTPKVLAGEKQTVYLRVGMTGMNVPSPQGRPPVNVTLVLDKSGSMQGEKIASARRAAKMAIDRLQSKDIVSVVTYDTTVSVLVPATRVSDKQAIFDAIDRIQAGGNTALFAGVCKGAQELRKFFDKEYVNRVILLSDGLANNGPSTPAELAELGTSLGREGIAVTTIGLGLGYNEDLMTRLAGASDGNHMFAEQPSDLEMAFNREFGDVLSVVAQRVQISIDCAPGVRPVRSLGREMDIRGQKAVTNLNQLTSNQMQYVLIELEVPEDLAGSVRPVADVALHYRDMATGQPLTERTNVVVSYVANAELVEKSENADVMVEVVKQIGNERNELAVQLRDEGKVEEARKVLNVNNTYLIHNSVRYNNEELNKEAEQQLEDASNLSDKDWTRQRKVMKENQYIKTQGKSASK